MSKPLTTEEQRAGRSCGHGHWEGRVWVGHGAPGDVCPGCLEIIPEEPALSTDFVEAEIAPRVARMYRREQA